MDISGFLYELLLTNECIVLPGFGGFETAYQPANIDPITKKILPPTKQIKFNREFTKGQGVVQDYLKEKLRLTDAEAEKTLSEFISVLQKQLEDLGETNINNIGKLYKNAQGEIVFEQEEKKNHLADSFGLESIAIKKKEIPEPTDEEVEAILKPIHQERKYTGTVVAIGVLVVLILLTSIFIISEKHDIEVFPFSLVSKKSKQEIIVIGANQIDTTDQTVKFIENQLRESTEARHALQLSSNENSAVPKRFHIIAGSFQNRSNAEELKFDLNDNGYIADIIKKGSFFRVVVASYSEKEKALSDLKRLQSELDNSIWLMEFEWTN